ncbi:MAG TPA: hypothetical protein VIS95_06880 [Solirubrobacterales bacterium]
MEVAKVAGSAAGVVALAWNITRYALDRRVSLRVTAKSEHRASDGIRVEVRNRSPVRSVKVRDFEVLHKQSIFKRRVAEKAGPFMEPKTPWHIGPDDDQNGWVDLQAVDGSNMVPGTAKWDFSKRVRVRLVLTSGRGAISRRYKIVRTP